MNEAKQDVERVTNKQRKNHWMSEQLKILQATATTTQSNSNKMQENNIPVSTNASIIDQAQFEADKRAVYK